MRKFQKPTIFCSRCLGFAACRFNGAGIPFDFLKNLEPHVNFITACPEVEIGLGAPRNPVRLVAAKGARRLLQPATGLDVTGKMARFADDFLSSLKNIDGFVLKSRSPSCGIKDVKTYKDSEKSSPLSGRCSGLFAQAAMARFPALPAEDEGRLGNFVIREHFLTRIFTLAAFREVKKSGRMRNLVQFQADNKCLLVAYSEKEMRALGRIVANLEKRRWDIIIADYEKHLQAALARPPRTAANINVLMHCMGHFSKQLNEKEKRFFLDTLDVYREGRVPLSAAASVLRSWIARFGEEYLATQTFFAPYPPNMIEITDSGKGRSH